MYIYIHASSCAYTSPPLKEGAEGPKDFVVPFSDTTNFAITPDAAANPFLGHAIKPEGPFVLRDIDRCPARPPSPSLLPKSYVRHSSC